MVSSAKAGAAGAAKAAAEKKGKRKQPFHLIPPDTFPPADSITLSALRPALQDGAVLSTLKTSKKAWHGSPVKSSATKCARCRFPDAVQRKSAAMRVNALLASCCAQGTSSVKCCVDIASRRSQEALPPERASFDQSLRAAATGKMQRSTKVLVQVAGSNLRRYRRTGNYRF